MYKVYESLLEQKVNKERSDRLFLLLIAGILAVMTAFIALNQYVYLNVSVSGPSMQPTLATGDVVIVNKLKQAEFGDIVVIKGVKDYWLIKRVIACDGETVEIKNCKIYIDGKEIEESYIKDGVPAILENNGVWKLKEGEIFYLGDNRLNSSDSRVYGVCKDENIVGVVTEWSMPFKALRGKWVNILAKLKKA